MSYNLEDPVLLPFSAADNAAHRLAGHPLPPSYGLRLDDLVHREKLPEAPASPPAVQLKLAPEEAPPSRWEIYTMGDLVSAATRENLPRLIADVHSFLDVAVRMKGADVDLRLEKLTWIDDGKTSISMEVRLEPPVEVKIERH